MRRVLGYIANMVMVAAVLVSTLACTKKQQLIIVSTNDIHSAIGQVPRLATLVDSLRSVHPGKVLLIDAGDRWTGNPYVDFAESHGKPIIDLMNRLNYDASTYGNHEWDNGVDTLSLRMSEANFPKILANADMGSTSMPKTDPYMFIDIDGLRVGLLGLITVDESGHPVGKDSSYEGITFTNPLDVAKDYSRLSDSCDLYVAVTHIGLKVDSLLALQSPEIDLIIGGHSHDVIPVGRKINETVVTQTGRYLKFAGVTVVTHNGAKVLNIENSLVDLSTIAPAPQYQELVEGYTDNPYFKQHVGEVTEEMDKIALMNLYSDALRVECGAQFAFHNMGGMRIDKQKGGEITLSDIYFAEPFANEPELFYLTLEEIKDLILNKFNGTDKESHTLDLYPSGMSYKIVTDGEGNGTDMFFETKQKPIKGEKYSVILSDYVGSAYNFAEKGKGQTLNTKITSVVREYIEKNSPIVPQKTNRVEIE